MKCMLAHIAPKQYCVISVNTRVMKCLASNKHPISQNPLPASQLTSKQQYSDVMMSAMASQITSLTIVYSTVYSGADQRKHQSSASQAFVRGIHHWPVNFPHKGPVTRKAFPFNDVIMSHNDVMTWEGLQYCSLRREPVTSEFPNKGSTSTVYWCIASKLKAARNLYWTSNMFLWVEIFLFFVCYHVFPKMHSQLDYELNDL